MIIKEILSAPREMKRIGEELRKHSKEIREGVKANGYCLDYLCKEFTPVKGHKPS